MLNVLLSKKHCKHIYISVISFQYETLKAKEKYENRTKHVRKVVPVYQRQIAQRIFSPRLAAWHKVFPDYAIEIK